MQASQRLDGYLVELVGLADIGLGTVLGVLVNGTTIVGRLVPEMEMAKVIDQHLSSVLQLAKQAVENPEEEQLLAEADTSPHERRLKNVKLREQTSGNVSKRRSVTVILSPLSCQGNSPVVSHRTHLRRR